MKDYLRKCSVCGLEAKSENDLDLFTLDKNSKYGRSNCCKECRTNKHIEYEAKRKKDDKYRERTRRNASEYYHKNKEKYGKSNNDRATKFYEDKGRNSHYLRKYGITLEEYNIRCNEQNNECLICKQPSEKLVVDHCHTTGEVRGLLCNKCNVGLGFFEDSHVLLMNAIKYLNKEL